MHDIYTNSPPNVNREVHIKVKIGKDRNILSVKYIKCSIKNKNI